MALNCSAPALAADANCLMCLTHKQILAAQLYALCVSSNVTTDPGTLSKLSACLMCMTEKQIQAAILYVECTSSGGGGTGVGLAGIGSPQSVVTANPGSTYIDTSTDNFWVKTTGTGNTGWTELIGN